MSLAGFFKISTYIPRWNHHSEDKMVDLTIASRRAVLNARQLEMKAMNCVDIAQRMLPNAEGDEVESLAADLMQLTNEALQRTLGLAKKYTTEIALPEEPGTQNRYDIAKDSALPQSSQPEIPSYTKPELTRPEYSMKGMKGKK